MFNDEAKKPAAAKIIGIAVIVLLVLAIASTFILCSMFKDSNTAPTLFGKRVYIMNGDGMNPRIQKGAAVFVDEGVMPESPGNVILCNIDGRLAVLGYVSTQDTTMADGSIETKYIVKYDNAPADQQWAVSKSDIIGKAVSYDTFLGAVIRFSSSKTGMLIVVIVPCAILVIYEIIMLIVTARRNKQSEILPDDLVFGDAEAFQIHDSGSSSRRKDVVEIKFEPDKALEASFKGEYDWKTEFKSLSDSSVKEVKPSVSDIVDDNIKKTEQETSAKPYQAGYAVDSWQQEVKPSQQVKTEGKPEHWSDYSKSESVANRETDKKIDEVARSITSNEPAKSTSARIDELIRLLEEEKARLADK